MALAMGQTAGSPRVTLTKTGADGEFQVTRTVAGVTTPVRGTLTVVGGTGTLVDREAPQGKAVTYRAGADTASGTTASVGAYLVHPTNPALDVALRVEKYPTWSREDREDVLQPELAAFPIVVTRARAGRTGDRMSLLVEGAAEAVALDALFEASRIVLLSTTQFVARYLWVAVRGETWEPLSEEPGDESWRVTFALTEIGRPDVTTSGIATIGDAHERFAGLTIGQVKALYAGQTIGQVHADARTWAV